MYVTRRNSCAIPPSYSSVLYHPAKIVIESPVWTGRCSTLKAGRRGPEVESEFSVTMAGLARCGAAWSGGRNPVQVQQQQDPAPIKTLKQR